MLKNSKGFTLIELMIVVAIVGILAAIALPSYQQYLMDGRRSEGQAALLNITVMEEQFFLDNKAFTKDLTDLGLSASPFITEHGYYSIAAACSTDPCTNDYTLTATPKNAQSGDGDLEIDEVGAKTGKW